TFDKTTGAGVMNNDTNALGGGHAHCGLAIYQSSLFPPTYRNQLLFGNLHGHRLVANYTDVKGSTYIGKHAADFLRANDMHFIPVTQKVGPDGALYVSDWSDQQICHRGSGAVEHWDRSNGRIYRVTYAGPPSTSDRSDVSDKSDFPKAPFDLAKETDEKLARLAVQTENEWFSRMARRVLMEQRHSGDDLRHAASTFIQTIQSPSTSIKRTRASWALLTINESLPAESVFSDKTEEGLLVWAIRNEYQTAEFSKARLSSNAYQLAAYSAKLPFDAILKLPVGNTQRVRRELASALQRIPQDQRKDLATALLKHGEDAEDPMIPLLIWYGIEPVVAADAAVGLQFAAVSKMPKVTEFIYRRLAGEEAGIQGLLKLAAESKDAALRQNLLTAVVQAARGGSKVSQPANWAAMREKVASASAESGDAARAGTTLLLELEAHMGIEAALKHFRDQLALATSGTAARESALKVLLQAKDAATAKILLTIVSNDSPASLRRQAIQALASLKDAETPQILGAALPKLSANELPDAVNTLASTKEGSKALLKAVEAKTVPATALSPFLVRQLTAFDDAEINALIKSAWGDVNAPKADLGERTKKYKALLTAAALAKGDLAKGKMLYMATCGQCHKLFGEGQNVGPDITGSNRADLNYLLENVLDPNAVIGKAYQLNLFT
ncbi:MAG: PVC-type heme-binding CxxCH protein, partial [bacterium]